MLFKRCLIISAAFICIMPLMLFAQIDNAGVTDRHFHTVLFPQVYKELASTKINYPGLRNPEKYSVSAGLLPDLSGENWSALYGWGEWANGPAIAGVWLGNIGFNSGSPNDGIWYDPYVNERVFSIRTAAWLTPFRSNSFKGVSVTYDALSKVFENEQSGGTYSMDSTFFGVISLVQLNANLHLRAGISSFYYATDSYYAVDPFIVNEKRSVDGIFVGVLNENNRALELRVSNSYHYFDEFFGEQVNDTVNVSLLFSGGKTAQYHKHRLFYGLKGEGGVSFLSSSNAGRFRYWRHISNTHRKGAIYGAELSSPLIFDIHLFRTFHGMLSINPQINYSYADNLQKLKSRHTLSFASPYPQLSFYGSIGEKIEFAIMPSIENEVFFSAAEVRYRF